MTSWTAPLIDPDRDRAYDEAMTDERTLLDALLDYHRKTLLWKCSGLTAQQLASATVEPSRLTLLGLVRHLAEVERGWFCREAAGETVDWLYYRPDSPDADFDDVAEADPEADLATFRAECERSRQAVADLPLEHIFTDRRGRRHSLRWVYLHMIEEYARHNGHADLIRERIDGATGE